MNAVAESPHRGVDFPGQQRIPAPGHPEASSSGPPVEPAQALPVAKAKPTTYRVFVLDAMADVEKWILHTDDVEASSDIAALKAAGANDEDELYVAIPKRSFRPRTPTNKPRVVTSYS